MPNVFREEFKITVVSPFEPQGFIFLLTQLPELFSVREINDIVGSSLETKTLRNRSQNKIEQIGSKHKTQSLTYLITRDL